MKRWPILCERKPEHLTSKRAKSLTAEVIQKWTERLAGVYTSAGLAEEDPQIVAKRVCNCDETAFATETTSLKVLAKRVLEVCMRLGVGVAGST